MASQLVLLFGVRVFDTDAPSDLSCTPQSILATAENDNKKKYVTVCEIKHVSFTPLCFCVDGLLGKEDKTFLKIMADRLAIMWNKSYSTVFH